MENARDNKKELWIILQDMKKAFNLVSLKALRKALERIKLPETTIKLILNLFENWQSRIITELGPTNFIKIQEGIELDIQEQQARILHQPYGTPGSSKNN